MNESSKPPAGPPGGLRVLVAVLIWSVFVVKVVRWWLAVSAGTTSIAAMGGWQWAKVGFYHLAVVAGVVGIIQMLRERARGRAGPPGEPGA